MADYCECPGRRAYFDNIVSAAEAVPSRADFQDCTLLITGATGLVGGSAVRTLLYMNRVYNLNMKLLCPVRSMKTAEQALPGIFGRRELNVFEADIEDLSSIPGPIDFIIHAAAPTASSFFVSNPADTARAVILGTMSALELAREKQVRGMVYVSSMEVYGAVSTDTGPRSENLLGYIDPASPRSSYSEGKRMAENLCACWAAQHKVPVRAARLAQTFGAGVSARDNRVYMQFIRSSLEGRDLILNTAGLSTGNYVHISDCTAALLTLLTRGNDGEAYNVCGDDCHMTIRALAELTVQLINPGSSVTVNAGDTSVYAPDTKLVMDNSKLKSLGWQPRFSTKDMILSLASDIREQKGRNI